MIVVPTIPVRRPGRPPQDSTEEEALLPLESPVLVHAAIVPEAGAVDSTQSHPSAQPGSRTLTGVGDITQVTQNAIFDELTLSDYGWPGKREVPGPSG